MIMNHEVHSLIFLVILSGASSSLLRVLPLDATGSATAERRLQREVNVLLRVQAHHKAWNVNHLFAHSDMSLSDEDTGVMDGLGQTEFVHLSLETTFKEIFNFQTQHVIELHSSFVQHSNTHQTTQQGVTFKQTFLVLLFQSQQLTSGLTDLGQGVFDPPHLALVTESILSDDLQLLFETCLLVRTTRSHVRLTKHGRDPLVHHCDSIYT
uniref:Uncharacterized protein n=1 Tax=Nilaparvata lugens TaxID=108931 RepID=A0A220XIH7_NILLU|nr:hypothetical protein [Nilaparvata lugens]